MAQRTLKGRVAIVGIGETHYYKHGQSPDAEFKLALQAVLRACADAGLDPRHIDGFASYGDDRSEADNLASHHPERVKQLRTKLDAWLANIGAQLPTPNPRHGR